MIDWSHTTVLVTGAGGFIGSHLTERLVLLGAKTRAFVRYSSTGSWGWLDHSPHKGAVEVFPGNVEDPETVVAAMRGADVVFHLAALIAIPYSYAAPRSYVRTNVEGTNNVLAAARELGVRRLVTTSTSEVYGTARRVPIDEDHPLCGQSPYSATKIAADKLAEAYYLSFGLPVTVVRPFNTYGPRQSARAIVPTVITQALTQREIRLGELRPTRDLNFVADTVEGFVLAAESERAVGQVINLGTGVEISIEALCRVVLDLLGKDLPIALDEQRLRPAESEVMRLCADASKAAALTGWRSRCALSDGLQTTIQWIERNLDRYRSGTYAV